MLGFTWVGNAWRSVWRSSKATSTVKLVSSGPTCPVHKEPRSTSILLSSSVDGYSPANDAEVLAYHLSKLHQQANRQPEKECCCTTAITLQLLPSYGIGLFNSNG